MYNCLYLFSVNVVYHRPSCMHRETTPETVSVLTFT